MPVELSPGSIAIVDAVGLARRLDPAARPSASTWACRGSCRSATAPTCRATTCCSSGTTTTRPTAIGMYTESIGNPRRFARIARRVSRRRPIVAVRTGAAAIGPSGGALYQHSGLIEVPTVVAMLDTVRVLAIAAGDARSAHRGDLQRRRARSSLARAAIEAAGLDARRPPITLDFRSTPDDYGAALGAALASGRDRRRDGDPRAADRVRGRRADRGDRRGGAGRHQAGRRRAPRSPRRADRSRIDGPRRSRSPRRPRRSSGGRTPTAGGCTPRPPAIPAAVTDVDDAVVDVDDRRRARRRPRCCST